MELYIYIYTLEDYDFEAVIHFWKTSISSVMLSFFASLKWPFSAGVKILICLIVMQQHKLLSIITPTFSNKNNLSLRHKQNINDSKRGKLGVFPYIVICYKTPYLSLEMCQELPPIPKTCISPHLRSRSSFYGGQISQQNTAVRGS